MTARTVRYEGKLYRPPSEADALIVQATIGCSWNHCTYCDMYRDKTFRVRELGEVLEDLERAGGAFGDDVEKLFVADGDALVLPMDHWLPILERARRLEPTRTPDDAGARPYAIAIFQVQDLARLAALQGERAMERTLQEVDRVLHGVLAPGDTIDRVTGSGEFIALLHGDDPEAALVALRSRFAAVEDELGTRVLQGFAQAGKPSESPAAVYLRADEALSAAKDAVARRAS